MSTIQRAIEIATLAHQGQWNWQGEPYIEHAKRVMLRGRDRDERIVGVLHDVVAKTHWTLEQLEQEEFRGSTIRALGALTPRIGEGPGRHLSRIEESPLAITVKMHDLLDEMDLRNLSHLDHEHLDRLNRALQWYRRLESSYKEVSLRFRKVRPVRLTEPPRLGRLWTPQEDRELERLCCQGADMEEITARLQRSMGAVRIRIRKLQILQKYGLNPSLGVEEVTAVEGHLL